MGKQKGKAQPPKAENAAAIAERAWPFDVWNDKGRKEMDRLQTKKGGRVKFTVVEDYLFRTHFPNQRARYANESRAEDKKKKDEQTRLAEEEGAQRAKERRAASRKRSLEEVGLAEPVYGRKVRQLEFRNSK